MVTVAVIDPKARKHARSIERDAALLLKLLGREESAVEISLVGNAELPKNVLAFPALADFPRPDLTLPDLGEIYLNPAYIEAHGEDLRFMLVHGMLHLLGYDHIKKSDRISMEKKERELLKKLL
jgi:probable rRNA maturation factor